MSYAAKVLSHRVYRRRHAIFYALCALVLVWVLLWGFTAYRLNKLVDHMTQPTSPLSYESRYMDGTFLTVHVHLEKPSLKQGSNELQAGEAVIYMPVWNWRSLSTKLRHGITGRTETISYSFDGLKFGVAMPDFPATSSEEVGLSFWLSALGITLPQEMDVLLVPRIDEISFDGHLMGQLPAAFTDVAIRAWNDASGVIEIDDLTLRWGPLDLDAKGTVALSNELQPEAAFSAKVSGLEQAIGQLRDNGKLSERDVSLLLASVGVLGRQTGIAGSSGPILPLSVQNNGLYVGPVKLMDIPRLNWPQEPNAQPAEPVVDAPSTPRQDAQPEQQPLPEE
ncbi:MAG: DUF2125 domain-containing protein [Proteobacteria bacterium]|nr:DUF2125 domain-containing protein [Pseudomonadota bacterium]